MKRLMIFVDHSNIFRSADEKKIRIDWKKLAKYLSESWLEKYDFVRCIMVSSVNKSKSLDEQNKLINIFNRFDDFDRFDVKRQEYIGEMEKKVDVQIAVDMVMLASRDAFDVAILCSGDSDFVPAVRAVMDLGKEVYVAGFDSSSSEELVRSSLGHIKLDNIKEIQFNPPEPLINDGILPKDEISMIKTGNNDEPIAKIREVLSRLEMEPEGIHLSKIPSEIKKTIPDFNHKNFKFNKLGEFLQFACKGTSLQVARFPQTGTRASELHVILRSRVPYGCEILPDRDLPDLHSEETHELIPEKPASPILTQPAPSVLTAGQIQIAKSYTDRLSSKIEILNNGSDDDWIAKIGEVLKWFESDDESYKEMKRNGLHLWVIQEALKHFISGFNHACLGFPEFDEFLQFACKGTLLRVGRYSPKGEGAPGMRVIFRDQILPGYDALPDLDRREIHSIETYKAILAQPCGPIINLPSKSAIVKTAHWISQMPFIETDLGRWIALATVSLNSAIDVESVKLAFLSFKAAGVFHSVPEGSALAEQRLAIPREHCLTEDILGILCKAAKAKIEGMLHPINQDVRLDVLRQLIPREI
jgi:uncharacterized LabA/DUF88 family protein